MFFPNEQDSKKVFITGIAGSGKTTLANKISHELNIPFISFDASNPYQPEVSHYHCETFLNDLPDAFVVDAIPFDEEFSWKTFSEYEKEHDITIICTYCPDRSAWFKRLTMKKLDVEKHNQYPFLYAHEKDEASTLSISPYQKTINRGKAIFVSSLDYIRRNIGKVTDPTAVKGLLKRIYQQGKKSVIKSPSNHGTTWIKDKRLVEYRHFYVETLNQLRRFHRVYFFDSIKKEFSTENAMLERIGAAGFDLEDYLFNASYDVGYQDIEILGLVGYSESYKTWQNIENLFTWGGKRIVDLGCFHGYFCFKIEDTGGKALGLDKGTEALEAARMINRIRGGGVEFREWVGGEEIPECDVTLCLNVLHHFGDIQTQEMALSRINSRYAIFEINTAQLPLVEKHFKILRKVKSHRNERVILKCERVEK
jgi:2-polyprenyl-3-methyl-5-hydroxy-6-metoxy-1,4-benzoquinol methylase